MIVDERITTYIHSLDKDRGPFFEELRSESEKNGVPIIRRETESFLRLLLGIVSHDKKEFNILEIGTAVGYSALVMAQAVNLCKITTIENYGPRLIKAKKNLSGHENIELIEEDAVKAIKSLNGPYDFIFLDAAKAQYIIMLPDLIKLMKKGSVMVADNVLQEGELIESRYVTSRRQRTIHDRMREFLFEIQHRDDLDSAILTVGDGISISVKK